MATGRVNQGAPPQQVRIIGGSLRSRRVAVPDEPGVRPSPDRVRETLFNWLQSVVPGARCLDLFAGSGALGFEAWSRGAASVVSVDRSARVTAHLLGEAGKLGIPIGESGMQIVTADAQDYLRRAVAPFDIVFLDPPFRHGLLGPLCAQLAEGASLSFGAYVYIEAEIELSELPLPAGWQPWRSGRAGQVGYHLVRVARPSEAG